MTKLSDTQAIILAAAAQRPDGNVLPLPGSLRGGAAGKVVTALLSRGLIREQVTDSLAKADAALKRVWRNENDGRAVLLVVTETGLEAVGVEADSAPVAPAGTAPASSATERPDEPHSARTTACTAAVGAPAAENAPDAQPPRAGRTATQRKTREGTKQAQLIAMLRRPEGATIAQIVEALGWQPHTVRGAFAGALKKKLGLTVTSEKVEGNRVYHLSL
jgi:hypothetical protein